MIPKVIHYCWFGNGEKNELIKRCIESWKKFCPDYEIIEWNESNYDVIKNQYMYEAYQAKRWGFVSDYARLDIIYNHGGIYLDTDVEIVKPLDDLLELKGFAGFERKYPEEEQTSFKVNTGEGFGAEAGNKVIELLLSEYNELHFVDENGEQNLTPSPYYNTKGIEKAGFVRNNVDQIIDGFAVFSANKFCPITNKDKEIKLFEDTYAIHYFNTSWLTAKEKQKRKRQRVVQTIKMWLKKIVVAIIGKNNFARLKGEK